MISSREFESVKAEKRPETIQHWMIECPETEEMTYADVSASSTIFFPSRRLRIKNCSRWPEREECQQQCLKRRTLASG